MWEALGTVSILAGNRKVTQLVMPDSLKKKLRENGFSNQVIQDAADKFKHRKKLMQSENLADTHADESQGRASSGSGNRVAEDGTDPTITQGLEKLLLILARRHSLQSVWTTKWLRQLTSLLPRQAMACILCRLCFSLLQF